MPKAAKRTTTRKAKPRAAKTVRKPASRPAGTVKAAKPTRAQRKGTGNAGKTTARPSPARKPGAAKATRATRLERTEAFIAIGTLAGLADDTLTGVEMQRMARWCLRRQGAGNVGPPATDAQIQAGIRKATAAIEAGRGSDLLAAAVKALPTTQDRLEALRGALYVVATETSRGLEGTIVPLLGALLGVPRNELGRIWTVLPMTRAEAVAALATMVASVDGAISKGELEVVMSWTSNLMLDWAKDVEAEHASRVEVRSGYERALYHVGRNSVDALVEECVEALPRVEDRLQALQAAIRVVMADRKITALEQNFLVELAGKLGLKRDEADGLLVGHEQLA